MINEKNDIDNQIKDKRLENINIPKGLVDALNNARFTIEIILNIHPSDMAQILGIDNYVAQIIHQETKYYYQMNVLDNQEIPNDNIFT
jgi:hypothetical protein